MRVVDIMMGTPYRCGPETNLGSATELMWVGNCGFLPVVGRDNRVAGVITDRDICVALGTRNRTAGNVTVGEVMSGKMFACAPEDEIETALETMRTGHVRRLPVITKAGALVGVVSIDDVIIHVEKPGIGGASGLSTAEVVKALQGINERQLPLARVQAAAAPVVPARIALVDLRIAGPPL
jgi:CBS domain-containing protein